MATIDGSIQLVKVVTDAELRQNGGSFVVAGRMAQPIQGFDTLTKRASGGNAIPVYVVSDAQIANGTFRLKGGSALPMADIDVVAAGVKTIQGTAIPVYVVSGSLAATPPAPPVPFDEQILALPGLVAYWPLTDTSGTTADNAEGTATLDGTYKNTPLLANVAFPVGDPVPLFDGTDECVDLYTAALAAAFDGDTGWFFHWFLDPTPMTPVADYAFQLSADSLTNTIQLQKSNGTPGLYSSPSRFGNTLSYSQFFSSSTSWHMVAMDWDRTGTGNMRVWVDGILIATLGSIGTWSAALGSAYTVLAARRGDTGGNGFSGSVGHAAVGAGSVLADDAAESIYRAVVPAVEEIVFAGDSKTAGPAGWCGYLAGNLTNTTGDQWRMNPLPFAVSGYTAALLHTYIDDNVGAANGNPSIACINIGVNNAAGTLPAEAAWKADLVGCIDGLRGKWPTIQVYVSRVWDRRDPTDCATLNGWINDVIATQDYIHPGPDESIWLENGDDGVAYTSDGTHYNAAGNVEAAAQWMTALGY